MVTTASRSRRDMTAVTVPPTVAGTDSMRASGAASTAAIALVARLRLLQLTARAELRDEQERDGGRQRQDARGKTRPGQRAAPQPGPPAGPGQQVTARRGKLPGAQGGGEYPLAHLRRRGDRGRHRQPGGGLPQPRTSSAQEGHRARCFSKSARSSSGQRVESVAAGQQVQFVTLDAHQVTPMQSRSLIRPSLIRVLIVPSGTPSSSAT